jgi:hypothetical protein
MQIKNIYVILILILVIIISQTFKLILELPLLREGLDTSGCLPDCENVQYDYDTNTIPECKKINVKLLKSSDATTIGLPIINTFISNMNNYINTKYSFDISVNQILNNTNPSQIEMNKYFTDFSGINYNSNQDILDNIISDPKFTNNLNIFTYPTPNIDIINQNQVVDPDKPQENYPTPDVKISILNIINQYNSDIKDPPKPIITIYTNFLNDISGMCIQLQNKCNKYYTDENLLSMINSELDEPTYSGISSSFHKVSEYIYKSINGTLTS